MAKRRGLGRGLDALLGTTVAGDPAFARPGERLQQLAVDQLQRGRFQPRSRIDEESLADLTRSIRAQGVVQPILVRRVTGGDDESEGEEAVFEIIAGERRWRAAQAAGLSTIPAVVREVGDDGALAMALIENIQREDLNPIEEAAALARLVEEFGLTHQAAADAVGRSRASVSNLLRLLELGAEVRRLLEEGALDMGHARALLGLSGEAQTRAAREVVAKGLSARQTEQLVRRLRRRPEGGTAAPARRDPDVARLERELSERIGAPVRVQHDGRGRGSLTVRFSSLEEFEGILERIR